MQCAAAAAHRRGLSFRARAVCADRRRARAGLTFAAGAGRDNGARRRRIEGVGSLSLVVGSSFLGALLACWIVWVLELVFGGRMLNF